MFRVEPAGIVVLAGIAAVAGVRLSTMVGEVASVMFTTKGAEAMALPFSSVAMAERVIAPTEGGAQTIDQTPAANVALPIGVPLVNTCTKFTGPSASDAFSVRVVLNPTGRKAPVAGVTKATVGGLPITFAISMAMGAVVLVKPLLSVTRAVSWWGPTSAGAVNRKL